MARCLFDAMGQKRANNWLDLTGHTFGRLTAILPGPKVGKHSTWHCNCSCGNSALIKTGNLRRGVTKSCGCYQRELAKIAHTTHGMKHTKEYKAWDGMRARCYNQNHDSFPNYGGRGISVCPRWLESFEAFFADIGPKPSARHSIDRIDNHGDYTPENCRWATSSEQAKNRRGSIALTAFGERKPLLDWVSDERCSIPEHALRKRIKAGIGHEVAITAPKTAKGGRIHAAKNPVY